MSVVNITVANPPAGLCIPQAWVTWLQQAIILNQSNIEGSQRILKQTTAPGPDDRDALWHKISGTGISLGLFTYSNGAWRRFPTTPIGARVGYTGPITGVFDPQSFIGIPGTEWDGWQLDFTFKDLFPVIASSYDAQLGAWQTMAPGSPQQQGGFASITLTPANVPLASKPAVTAFLHARGNPGIGDFVLWGEAPTSGTLSQTTIVPADPGNPAPTSFQILPPFVAQAQIVYIGIAP
jgi:hypothetical protein